VDFKLKKVSQTRVIFLLGCFMALEAWSLSCHAQIHILGRNTLDTVLPAFFTRQTNGPTTIDGLNANAGGHRFADALMPLSFAAKVWDGTQTGTNRMILQTWDTNNAAYQQFEFTLNGGLPLSVNTVSRIGFPETNTYKIFNLWRAQTNGTFQTGVLVARGTSYGDAIAGKTGVNRIPILHTYETGATNYMEFTDGVFTNAQ
jgi:hypothetical protein